MSWQPRSGLDSYRECVWLPRLIEKARYLETRGITGNELGNGYLYGASDFIDGKLLRFLGLTGDRVRTIVGAYPDDEEAAKAVLAESGKSTGELRAFSEGVRKQLSDFYLIEADEGRATGMRASLTRLIYNVILMPIFRSQFRRAEATLDRTR